MAANTFARLSMSAMSTSGVHLAAHSTPNTRHSEGRMPDRRILLASISICACVGVSAPSLAQGRRGTPVTLPDGPGKDIVASTCARCHALSVVTNDGYTRQEWPRVFGTMVDLPRDRAELVADYLAIHFPEKPKPPAVLISGGETVAFKEWPLPTKGSRPHDPLATADGALWYTAQFANKLGRVDMKTGTIKEFPLKTDSSGPHGLVADKSGNIWFTANSKGYIGKLDPRTGNISEYRLPPAARDPHTPIFDQRGTLWFTVQGANMVGRLDPSTGAVKVVSSPTPRSSPYGIVVSSAGVPFFVEFGANKVARIDPASMTIREYVLPNEAARPRRVAIDNHDVLWYSDYARGYLGRLDPKTGQTREWPSPGGPKSHPYAIAFSRNAIWYVESAVKPNALVRFDPKTETFQTWLIPGGGGVVRNMMPTREGNLVLAESGLNMVALAEIAR
jgi:virginiamycin B lyase